MVSVLPAGTAMVPVTRYGEFALYHVCVAMVPATKVSVCCGAASRHVRIVMSLLPLEASVSPSELMASPHTGPVCPVSVRRSAPVARSHTLIEQSSLAEMMFRPSCVTITRQIGCVWPVPPPAGIVRMSEPVA